MQKITTFLWFNGNAEDAMHFYTSVFNDSKIVSVSRYGDAGPGPKGAVMTGIIQIEGQQFYLLNGGPQFSFTPAVSFFVSCETQEEIDDLWNKLCDGGEPGRCGWLKDKFGLSWQIVPSTLGSLLNSGDAEKSKRAMMAMMQMTKFDIEGLMNA